MITLFVIVVIATLVLAVTRAEGMRPLGLALVGMISLVLGASTTAIFTETSVAPLVNSMVLAQDVATTAEETVAKTAESDSTKANDEPAAQPQEAAETSEPASSDPNVDAEKSVAEASDSATDVASADETEPSGDRLSR